MNFLNLFVHHLIWKRSTSHQQNLYNHIYFSCLGICKGSLYQSPLLWENRQFCSSCLNIRSIDSDLKKILFKREYILNSSSVNNQDDPPLGLLSYELLSNWKSEWWRSLLCTYKENHFLNQPHTELSNKTLNIKKLHSECVFKNTLFNLINKINLKINSPLSFIIKTVPANSTGDASPFSDELIKHSAINELLCIAVCVDEDNAVDKFENYSWLQTKWLRNYFRKPAKLQSLNNDCSIGLHETCHYNSDEGKFVMQESFLLKNSFLQNSDCWKELHRILPHNTCELVVIIHPMKTFLLATFVDAYHTIKVRPGYNPTLLCLHRFLAPIKMAVVVEESQSSDKLILAGEICQKIREMNISCWNAVDKKLLYSDLDQTGVVYSVVINDKTMKNGLVGIRNRDTSLSVITHVSELFDKLYLYLAPPLVIDNK